MYQHLKVSVVIPAFNEEAAIEAVIEAVPKFIDRIIVVDDASTDQTFIKASEHPRQVKAIQHQVNRGVGAAITTGYKDALAQQDDIVVVMAGDGQMDPIDLPALLEPIIKGKADYVKGNRFAHRELLTQMPPIRIAGNILLSYATKLTSGYTSLFDSQCGYTALGASMLKRLALDEVFPRYGYPNDLLAHLHRQQAQVCDVPVRPIYGPTWKSGVRWHTVVYPISFILLRSWYKRKLHEQRQSP